jgi:hypothetical protein
MVKCKTTGFETSVGDETSRVIDFGDSGEDFNG